jgi:hypothetical protein
VAGENYSNTASTATTSTPVGPSDTTAALASFTGWPSQPFWAEFEKDTASAEIVRVTNVAGSTITMTRGQGGTAATTHGAGVTVELIAPADFFNRAEQHMAATSSVHGASGSVVGTSGAQTVSDKLIRGALKSQHSDALPAGITASVETVADNTSARDGHVHRNTAGDANKRGFLLQQSGTDRFQVYNDGTVDIAPGTSGRPGLRNHGTTTLDGATTHNAAVTVTAGGINVTGGVVASGGAIITGSTDLAATTVDSLSSDTTVHATGNLDTDANLVVDGTSTLTGAVTTGAGLTVGSTLAVTQGITSWGSRVPMSVANTSAVTTPVTGDLIWDRSAKLWKEWSGSTWAVVDRPYAYLRQTVTQTVPSATFTAITFNVEDLDNVNGHSTVTNTSRYTCQTGFDGVYQVSGGASFGSPPTTGSRTVRISKNGTAINGSQGPGHDGTATGITASRTVFVRLAAGDYVEIEGYQSTGAGLGTNVNAESQSSMTVMWVAP